MLITRRSLLVGGTLAIGAALMRPALSATGEIYYWDQPGHDRYKDWHEPDRPLREGHIQWGEEMNDQLLEAMEKEYFYDVTLSPATPPEERTWDGMYFGDDRVISTSTDGRKVYAEVEKWPDDAPRNVRRYLAQTGDMAAFYDVPEVCGNPSWKMLKGTQPLCIPRPGKRRQLPQKSPSSDSDGQKPIDLLPPKPKPKPSQG